MEGLELAQLRCTSSGAILSQPVKIAREIITVLRG